MREINDRRRSNLLLAILDERKQAVQEDANPQMIKMIKMVAPKQPRRAALAPAPSTVSEELALVALPPQEPPTSLCLAPPPWANRAASSSSKAKPQKPKVTVTGSERKGKSEYEIFALEQVFCKPGSNLTDPEVIAETKRKWGKVSDEDRKYYKSRAMASRVDAFMVRQGPQGNTTPKTGASSGADERHAGPELSIVRHEQQDDIPGHAAIVPHVPHSELLVPYPHVAFGEDGLPKRLPLVKLSFDDVMAPPMTITDFEAALHRCRKLPLAHQTQVVRRVGRKIFRPRKEKPIKDFVKDFDQTHRQMGGTGPVRKIEKVILGSLHF